jgi:hypothetical protein
MTYSNGGEIGVELANRLGLGLPRSEGHDLAGPCVACQSSDAFRLHQESGVAQCYSCGRKWSPFQVAEVVLKDRDAARTLMSELGVLPPQPGPNGQAKQAPIYPLLAIAQQKGITLESLKAYGAEVTSPTVITLPVYGPDGKPCSSFTMSTKGGKGLFAKGKPAGLFFPHESGAVRLPKAGETWHMVEGPKDAAALHGLGLLAVGMNTCRLAAKFARLFKAVDVIAVPDRDQAGEEGAQHAARVLRGVSKSMRIAALPAEFKESQGEDVRDILKRTDGRLQLMQAIADAQPADLGDGALDGDQGDDRPNTASVSIDLPDGAPLTLEVHPSTGKPQRLVVAVRGEVEHRDRIDPNSSVSRDRFVKKVAAKLGLERDSLAALIDTHITKLADQSDEAMFTGSGDDSDPQSQATMAVNMAETWDLWHTPAKDGYATIPIDGHFETWSVKSQMFKRYVAKQFFDENGTAMNSDALSAAVNLLEAKALFDGEERLVHVRVAEHEGKIYIDLCNDAWQVVEISPTGLQVLDECPVRFRRSRGMLPLPMPESGGSVDELRAFLNVDDTTWCLIVAWLVAAFRPRGPYLLLALFAEQGSGKSTTGRMLRALVDPNAAALRSEPKDGRDLMIMANNSWSPAFDNLSHIPGWLSDALCRLSTGGGFATRELYTDQDEIIFDSQRPVLLTSIEEVATRSDLLQRCLIVWLSAIPEEQRRPEAELCAAFEQARPRIFGALLDAVAGALQNLPQVKLPTLPRMADFALWVTAAEQALGWAPGTFLAAYHTNQASANDVALEAAAIAPHLLDLLNERGEWNNSASELLRAIEAKVPEPVKRENGWPKNARSLSGQLKRLAPNLRAAGWCIESERQASRRVWVIRRMHIAASSEEFASFLRHDPEPDGDGEAMPSDADWCRFPSHDANDADDANSGDRTGGSEWNSEAPDEVPF